MGQLAKYDSSRGDIKSNWSNFKYPPTFMPEMRPVQAVFDFIEHCRSL